MAKTENTARQADWPQPAGADPETTRSAIALLVSCPASTGRSAARLSRGECATSTQATQIAAIIPTPSTCQNRTSAVSSARAPRPATRKVHPGNTANSSPRRPYSALQKAANRPRWTSCGESSGRGMRAALPQGGPGRLFSGDRFAQPSRQQDPVERGRPRSRNHQIEPERLAWAGHAHRAALAHRHAHSSPAGPPAVEGEAILDAQLAAALVRREVERHPHGLVVGAGRLGQVEVQLAPLFAHEHGARQERARLVANFDGEEERRTLGLTQAPEGALGAGDAEDEPAQPEEQAERLPAQAGPHETSGRRASQQPGFTSSWRRTFLRLAFTMARARRSGSARYKPACTRPRNSLTRRSRSCSLRIPPQSAAAGPALDGLLQLLPQVALNPPQDLADARLGHAQDLADLAVGQLLFVIERQDGPLALGEPGHRLAQLGVVLHRCHVRERALFLAQAAVVRVLDLHESLRVGKGASNTPTDAVRLVSRQLAAQLHPQAILRAVGLAAVPPVAAGEVVLGAQCVEPRSLVA